MLQEKEDNDIPVYGVMTKIDEVPKYESSLNIAQEFLMSLGPDYIKNVCRCFFYSNYFPSIMGMSSKYCIHVDEEILRVANCLLTQPHSEQPSCDHADISGRLPPAGPYQRDLI